MMKEKSIRQSGQALVEFVLFLPILIITLLGLVEVGFLFHDYMILADQVRELARYGAQGIAFYALEDVGPDSNLFANAKGMGLTHENSAIRVVYVTIGKDEGGNATLEGATITNWGRTDEVEFPPLDTELMITEHQRVLGMSPQASPITWVGVAVARWHGSATGFFDWLGDEPIAIKDQAVFRVAYSRKFRDTPSP